MTELESRGRGLEQESLLTLVTMFGDLPIDHKAPNWPTLDRATYAVFTEEKDWLLENLVEIANNFLTADEVDYRLKGMESELVNMAMSGEEWITYAMSSMRAMVWEVESVYWEKRAEQDYADENARQNDLDNMKTCLVNSSKLYMVSCVLGGFRDPKINEVVINDLAKCGYKDEAQLLNEASIPKPQPGSFGRQNPSLN